MLQIIQSTPEVPETESANILISSPSSPSADPFFFDEIDSWLSTGVDDNNAAAGGAESAGAGESSDEFIVISQNDEVETRAVRGPSIPDLPEVNLIESDLDLEFKSQDYPDVGPQLTRDLDDNDQLLLRAGGGEEANVVGVSSVASVDSAFEDAAFNAAANASSPNSAAQVFADNAILSLDLLGPAVDASGSFDAATPTSGDAAILPADSTDKTDAAAAVGATAVGNDDSDEEIYDDDDDDDFAKIMATARKMDARAKEQGDSDPSAPVGNFLYE